LRDPIRLAPEDRGRIGLDLGEQRTDVRRRIDPVVAMPALVAVALVEQPDTMGRDVAELRRR
jgi:hypothetical protein